MAMCKTSVRRAARDPARNYYTRTGPVMVVDLLPLTVDLSLDRIDGSNWDTLKNYEIIITRHISRADRQDHKGTPMMVMGKISTTYRSPSCVREDCVLNHDPDPILSKSFKCKTRKRLQRSNDCWQSIDTKDFMRFGYKFLCLIFSMGTLVAYMNVQPHSKYMYNLFMYFFAKVFQDSIFWLYFASKETDHQSRK